MKVYNKFHKTIFVICVFLLLFIGAITFKHSSDTRATSNWVNHTYDVNIKLEELYSNIKDSEINIRGFLISQDSSYLFRYQTSEIKIFSSTDKLDSLVVDSKIQQNNLERIRELVNQRNQKITTYLNDNIFLHSSLDNKILSVIDENNLLLLGIKSKMNVMLNLEKDNLQMRNQNYMQNISLTPLLTLSILFISLALLVFTFAKINLDYEKLKKANVELSKAQFLSQQAEILSEYGTWDWDLTKGEITYSTNLFRILGIDADEFKKGKSLSDYVHPEDSAKVEEATKRIINGEDISHFHFRVIDTSGRTKHLRATGKLFEDELNNKTALGITEDITIDYIKTQQLRERNKELELNINELSEFNHVASHDLQEPLRKIETFISRVTEKEAENLSEFGRDYLVRITRASDRMRTLINDLLLYSRTSRTDKNFEEVNLAHVLSNSIVDLSQQIENTKAIIHLPNTLPHIMAIDFQIQQLFINIISNSIKYSKVGVAPIIDITYQIIDADKEVSLSSLESKTYHKFDIKDNGIGFDQENAEKIFLLFNRLHGKTEYVGTGVGLAICKKIVENHNGFIFAKGEPGEGSTFTVYLPA